MRPWMVLGTASDVGKSVITAGICRWLHRRGQRVAPFKAQNMSLNSYVTMDGGEMGWAQAAQATACGRMPETDFNPVLIKPVSSSESQIIVQGKVWQSLSAPDYYGAMPEIWPKVMQSYQRVVASCDRVILEGAGGAAELNLGERDITNFNMARHAHADVILVGDIERGGVFASVLGTLDLLNSSDRDLVRGIIINKFRGDPAYFEDGVKIIEQRAGVPVLGVLPAFRDIAIPEEDAMALQKRQPRAFTAESINIAVVRLPHLANFTDFAELEREPDVCLRYVESTGELAGADVLIVPGTKTTLGDLAWMHTEGWWPVVQGFSGQVVGVCGGYQMLGVRVMDPTGVDGHGQGEARGMALLPIATTMAAHKTVRQVRGASLLPEISAEVHGYEIHAGQTKRSGGHPAFHLTDGGTDDGCRTDSGRIWGSYLHGLFSEDAFRKDWLRACRRSKYGVGSDADVVSQTALDPYDAWTDFMQAHVDLTLL